MNYKNLYRNSLLEIEINIKYTMIYYEMLKPIL